MSLLKLALTALTGGGTGSLDKIDGAILSDGDAAVVVLSTGVYHYHLNATSGVAENSPYVISPDTNAGTKRWVLVTSVGSTSHVKATTDAGQSIPHNTATIVVFEDEEKDELSELNSTSGIFTATYAGYYLVNSTITFGTESWTNDLLRVGLFLNSTTNVYGMKLRSATISATLGAAFSGVVYLAATEFFAVRIHHTQGSTISLSTAAGENWVSIDRLV